jgi:hypothetical protein
MTPSKSVATQQQQQNNNNSGMNNSNNDDKLVWETHDDWIDRMGKILGVFAEIVGINKETPFSIEDGWIWLINMTNLGCFRKKQPFFMAEALDIFLRISAIEMNNKYGNYFIKILKMIKVNISPTLSHNDNRKTKNSIERLNNFLDSALDSRKPVFLTMVSKT